MRRPAFLAPLVHRRFRLLASGQFVSCVGDWLDFVGLIVLVAFRWHEGPTGLALLAVAMALPWVVVAPLAGVLADRLPGRPVLVGCDLARAGVVVCYLLAPNLAVLLALVALKTCFTALFAPAEQVMIKATVPERDLRAANALTTLIAQGTKVIGPAIGGLLVTAGGPTTAFVADAVTFVASAAILIRLPSPPRGEAGGAGESGAGAAGEAEGDRGSVLSSMREGVAAIVRIRALALAVAAMSGTVFLVFAFDALSPLALARLGLGPSLLGVAITCVGLGAVLGAVGFGQYGDRLRPLTAIGASQICAGLLVACLGAAAQRGLDTTPLVWFAVLTAVGGAAAGIFVTYPYVLQREAPEGTLGRVTATALAITTAVQLAAPPLGGLVAGSYGVGVTFVAAGTGLVLLGLVLIVAQPGRPGGPAPKPRHRAPRKARQKGGTTMTESVAVRRLVAVGIDVDAASDRQRQVLASLSDDEVGVITAVKRRLDAAGPDVQAHSPPPGCLIW